MKRKLSNTSGETSGHESDYGQGSVDERVQPSSALELEQNPLSSEAGGLLLAPHLALSLGMQPGEMLFRSMFYGTPQASRVSSLAAQLLSKHEELLRHELGEGTSSAVQSSSNYNTIASSEATIRALLDSVEAPPFAAVPEVVVEESDATYWQAPGASEAVVMGDVGTAYWQAPGAPEAVVMGNVDTTYYQAPGASEAVVMRNVDTTYYQAPGASEAVVMRNVDTAYWQAPGAPEAVVMRNVDDTAYWQAPGAPEAVAMGNVDTAYCQAPGAPEAVVMGDVGAAYWQVPNAPGYDTEDSNGGFMLAPDLALKLGMQPNQVLRRGMFCNTPQSNVILDMVGQLYEIREDLLRNQESERSGAIQEELSAGCGDTADLIATNEELIGALMGSIEVPTVGAIVKILELEKKQNIEKVRSRREKELKKKQNREQTRLRREIKAQLMSAIKKKLKAEKQRQKWKEAAMKNLEKEQKRKEKLRKKEEEAAMKSLEKEKEKLRKKEREAATREKEAAARKKEAAARKEEAAARKKEAAARKKEAAAREKEAIVKSREEEIETALGVAVCREAELERVKNKVRESIRKLETIGSLGSGGRDIEVMNKKEEELRRVVPETMPKNRQEMEEELNKARKRYKELEQAGAREASVEMDYLVTRETKVRRDLQEARAREMRVKNLEEELRLVTIELDTEKGTSEKEIDRVRMKKTRIEKDIVRLRATTGGSLELQLELDKLIMKKKEIDKKIDREKKEIELNEFKKEAKAELGERELGLMLRLEGIKASVKMLELELGIWLSKITAEKIRAEKKMASRVLGKETETETETETKTKKTKTETKTKTKTDTETNLNIAMCRKADLEKVKNKVKESMEKLEAMGSLSSKRIDEMMKTKERELRRVVAEPRLEKLQEMEKELNKAKARYKELEQAGVGEISVAMDYLVIKERKMRRNLKGAMARETKVINLEKWLKLLEMREINLEKGKSEKELGEVRTKKANIEANLVKLRATTESDLEIELGKIIAKKEEIEASIDKGKKKMELDRLKKEAGAELEEEELELMLRLEGVSTRIKVLELELGLWLGKIIAKKLDIARAEKEASDTATPEISTKSGSNIRSGEEGEKQ
ncbi:hypothetical protein [Candidatus Ichthyocystis sparus]|uniref:hypothetical protein n=1 Tax=Candidatus Ichthyocystis sparus TaxID=1561004 RepID=UPI000A9B8459|nr:hypothetical protein [Candidatus Ichthyocystis sparus]